MSVEVNLVEAASEWQGRIEELQALIASLEAELVEAEVGLAEELTAVNAFEFKLRAGVRKLIDRLEQLSGQIGELKKKLRQHHHFADGDKGDWSYEQVGGAYHEEPLDHTEYRYHGAVPQPPEIHLDEDGAKELKRLYRDLARRFHPDMASGDEDRQYRTQLMMAINAAYAAGDLEKLKALALEPDLFDKTAVSNDEQLVTILLRELGRLQRRLSEIQDELGSLHAKKNYRLMKQADRAGTSGQDWLANIQAQLQEEIAHKLVERDVLKQQLEMQEILAAEEAEGLQGDAFADAIWDFSLETSYDLDPDTEAEDWVYRHNPDAFRGNFDDDELD